MHWAIPLHPFTKGYGIKRQVSLAIANSSSSRSPASLPGNSYPPPPLPNWTRMPSGS
jgi:hypothetical protein